MKVLATPKVLRKPLPPTQRPDPRESQWADFLQPRGVDTIPEGFENIQQILTVFGLSERSVQRVLSLKVKSGEVEMRMLRDPKDGYLKPYYRRTNYEKDSPTTRK